ncbi:MAG: hypothetical protein V2J89_07870 [Halieaceae bacterium]|jgi:hypothetical protein|nr:hypothetical protein [Halieaceae bacterium]
MFKSIALMSLLALIGCQAVADSVAVVSESLQMTEARVPVERIGSELVDVSVDISYRKNMTQADYPDFIQLKQDLRTWTDGFEWTPEEGKSPRGWEALASALSTGVLANYPTINFVALTVSVYPNARHPYARSYKSLALRPATDANAPQTDLSVTLPIESHGIDHQGPNVIDLTTELHYADGATDYPAVQDVYGLLFEMMEAYPVESDYWETLMKSMSADLLETYPQFDAIDMTMLVYPTESVSYFHRIHCRTERDAR